MTFSKNDRVEFEYEGETIVGTVSRGGKTPKVIADGAKHSFNVPVGLLRKSDTDLPQEPDHPMNAWTLSVTSEIPAYIRKNWSPEHTFVSHGGRAVIAFLPDHFGGGLEIKQLEDDETTNWIRQFYDDCKAWLTDLGYEQPMYSVDDFWLDWKKNKQPYAVTAALAVAEANKSWQELCERHGTPGAGPKR